MLAQLSLYGSGHNYSREAANFLANLLANFSEELAFLVTHNRTVNVSGQPGKGKAIDMAVEHNNLILKNALRSSGANVTEEHLKTVSMASQTLHDAALLCDEELGVASYGGHRTSSTINEIDTLVKATLEGNVMATRPGRSIDDKDTFVPHYTDGIEKCIGKQWLKKFLRDTATIADFEFDELENQVDTDCTTDIFY